MSDRRISRRKFIAVAAGAAMSPVGAQAQQQSGRIPHIAYLGVGSPSVLDPPHIEQLKQGLAEHGLVEGRNIVVEYVWAEGDTDRIHQLARDLAQRNLDVIVTAGPQPVRALVATKTKTPIVFAVLSDPVGDGIIESLARPGGNVTGLSMANSKLESKRLEILRDAFPALKRVAILHDPTMGNSGLDDAQSGARALSLEALIFETNDPAQFAAIFAEAADKRANGLAVMASPLFYFHRSPLIDLAAQHRLPSIWEAAAYVKDGGLLSYGPSFPDMYRRAAGYVAKILSGARPNDLPVEQPIKFELAINMKTARSLGVDISPALLARADVVIE
jgi:putative ABC transport system substrate-binding protein